jgi:hypothetical protein
VPLENPERSELTPVILRCEFSPPLPTSLLALFVSLRSILRSRADLQVENLALRHQIGVPQRSVKKCRAVSADILHFPARVSSDSRQRVGTPNDFVPEPGSADLLVPRAIPRSPGCAPGCTSPWGLGRTVGQHSMVTRPRTAEGILARRRSVAFNAYEGIKGRSQEAISRSEEEEAVICAKYARTGYKTSLNLITPRSVVQIHPPTT